MIVYSCSDLIFATKIASTAEVLGVAARPARNVSMLRARLEQVDDGKANEPVTCVMVDLELGEAALELIQAAAGFGGVEVIAFGPHVMTEALEAAAEAGAGLVMARGAFTARLPDLIRGHAG